MAEPKSFCEHVDEVRAAGRELRRELFKTAPLQALLRLVDRCPWLERRPWARDL